MSVTVTLYGVTPEVTVPSDFYALGKRHGGRDEDIVRVWNEYLSWNAQNLADGDEGMTALAYLEYEIDAGVAAAYEVRYNL